MLFIAALALVNNFRDIKFVTKSFCYYFDLEILVAANNCGTTKRIIPNSAESRTGRNRKEIQYSRTYNA